MSRNERLRLLFILAFSMPPGATYSMRATGGPKEGMLMNYAFVAPLLQDVDWDVDPGPVSHHGTSLVETREEFAAIAAGRLPIVRKACESGAYDAIVLLGGGDPGFIEAREIAQRFAIPVTSCAHSQMHFAAMVANRFSVIDVSEPHSVYYASLVRTYGFSDRCASIRILDCPLPRADAPGVAIGEERDAANAGRPSTVLERAVAEAAAAIEEDGAEAIMIGCSALFWLRPHLERHLAEAGWDVPVLEGYATAIAMAKTMATLGLSASGVTFPRAPAPRSRRVKRF